SDQLRTADRGQVDEECAIGEAIEHLRSDLQPQPGLPRAARPGQRYQARRLTTEQLADGGDFLLPPNEGSRLHRQVLRPGFQRPQGREVAWQIRQDNLEQALRKLEVLDPM